MMEQVYQTIAEEMIVPVVQIDQEEQIMPLLRALQDGGARVIEITYRTAHAGKAIETAKRHFPNLLVGAGTVVEMRDALEALAKGASFLVSPGFSDEVSKVAKETATPYFGGAVTPSEVMRASAWRVVKFFPAEQMGGISLLKTYQSVFPQVLFMPTGGINMENLRDYLLQKNVVAVGGTWLATRKDLAEGNYEAITQKVMLAKAVVESVRGAAQ